MSDEPAVLEQVAAPVEEEREPVAESRETEGLVESDLLVEDVSIDGMCGVY
jgi:mycofactocin precursor